MPYKSRTPGAVCPAPGVLWGFHGRLPKGWGKGWCITWSVWCGSVPWGTCRVWWGSGGHRLTSCPQVRGLPQLQGMGTSWPDPQGFIAGLSCSELSVSCWRRLWKFNTYFCLQYGRVALFCFGFSLDVGLVPVLVAGWVQGFLCCGWGVSRVLWSGMYILVWEQAVSLRGKRNNSQKTSSINSSVSLALILVVRNIFLLDRGGREKLAN